MNQIKTSFESTDAEILTINSKSGYYFIGTGDSLICLEENASLRYKNKIDAGVTCITFYGNMVVCGCSNGIVVIFDLLSG